MYTTFYTFMYKKERKYNNVEKKSYLCIHVLFYTKDYEIIPFSTDDNNADDVLGREQYLSLW